MACFAPRRNRFGCCRVHQLPAFRGITFEELQRRKNERTRIPLIMRALVLLTAFLLSLASPARAANDVAAAQTVIRSQVEALGRDDAATPSSFTPPAI